MNKLLNGGTPRAYPDACTPFSLRTDGVGLGGRRQRIDGAARLDDIVGCMVLSRTFRVICVNPGIKCLVALAKISKKNEVFGIEKINIGLF